MEEMNSQNGQAKPRLPAEAAVVNKARARESERIDNMVENDGEGCKSGLARRNKMTCFSRSACKVFIAIRTVPRF